MNIGYSARFGLANDNVLEDYYQCGYKSISPKSPQELSGHYEVVEYKKDWNQYKRENGQGFQPLTDDAA